MPLPCQLCKAVEHVEVSNKDRHGNPLLTVLCKGCGVITNDPIPNDEELVAFYSKDYRKDYKGAAMPRMRQVYRNFGRLEEFFKENTAFFNKPMRVLDLGAGSGEFMFLAKSLGMDCIGIEPSTDYSDYCRDMLGLNVKTQTLEDTQFAEGTFDHIHLSHVLEHMNDPVRSLKVLHKWLKPDGVLYIAVPNMEMDAQHKMRGRMFHFGHIFNFNPLTLRLAASLANFEEAEISHQRLGNTTSGFFVPKNNTVSIDESLSANAEKMLAHMEAHNRRLAPKPTTGNALSRFVKVISLRISESLGARRFKDQRAIADYYAKRLAR